MRYGRDREAGHQPPVADEGRPGIESGEAADQERAGEPACWAHLVCPACGAMISEGHREGCQWDETAGGT